jgi:hypothetical protein
MEVFGSSGEGFASMYCISALVGKPCLFHCSDPEHGDAVKLYGKPEGMVYVKTGIGLVTKPEDSLSDVSAGFPPPFFPEFKGVEAHHETVAQRSPGAGLQERRGLRDLVSQNFHRKGIAFASFRDEGLFPVFLPGESASCGINEGEDGGIVGEIG